MLKFLRIILFLVITTGVKAQPVTQVDVCIYGGTSGGVIAAYTAKKMGKPVLLIEPGKQVGGLTTGGLGYTDIGNKIAITGLARDFYRRIGQHYGKFEQWIFEPHVAKETFGYYLKTAGINVLYQHRLVSVKKENGVIKSITIEHAGKPGSNSFQVIKAKMFIDCTYEGDLMAKAGVSYFTGRESNALYQETYNGVQLLDLHQFPDGIDPYKIPGKPESGLLWGISPALLDTTGAGDKKIQAYNIRICLTDNPANRIAISKPNNYDASKYELLLRFLEKKPVKDLRTILKFDLMPNHKTDINNNGPFSTDMIGMNYEYPDGDYATRDKIQIAHDEYVKGLLYFIGHDERMPVQIRDKMLQWGYPKDEYTDNGNWSPQMYVREARRMNGEYVMTQANCEGKEIVKDKAGMAAYTMDSHNCQRVVVNGMVKNEGDVEKGGFGPYPIAYRSLIPKAAECKNLLVPVCLSATHIAYGSIRMEPVFMVLSQSAAVAAVLAINANTTVQQLDVVRLQQELVNNPLVDHSVAEILVDDVDESLLTIKGDWKKEGRGSYGASMLTTDGIERAEKSVRFTPKILKAGQYKVYAYFPKLTNRTTSTSVLIYDGKAGKELTIKDSDIRVEGQTSGEWVSLGAYHLSPGNKAYAEISNKNATGIVAADAVIFVPDFK